VVESGAHELEARGELETFAWGDELPGGVVAVEVGAISPDETAFHIRAHDALVIADAAVRWEGVPGITFVPDFLMDDPEHTKAGLREAFVRLLDLDWHLLLLAHGEPVLEHAKDELRALAEG